MNILQGLQAPQTLCVSLNQARASTRQNHRPHDLCPSPVHPGGHGRPGSHREIDGAATSIIAAPTGTTASMRTGWSAPWMHCAIFTKIGCTSACAGQRPETAMESALYEGWVRHRRQATPAPRVQLPPGHVVVGPGGTGPGIRRAPAVVRGSPATWPPSGAPTISVTPALPLAEAVRQEVARHSGRRPEGPIRLLTQPRCLGLRLQSGQLLTTASGRTARRWTRSSPRSRTRPGRSATPTCCPRRRAGARGVSRRPSTSPRSSPWRNGPVAAHDAGRSPGRDDGERGGRA